jgi:hypothetical protein
MVVSFHGLEKEGELVVLRGPELLCAHHVRVGKWRGEENHKCRKRNGGKDDFVSLRQPEVPVNSSCQ